MRTFTTILIFCTLAGAGTITGVPRHGRRFQIPIDPADSIGSVYRCEDRIHRRTWRSLWTKHGVGYCEIPPASLRPGRTMRLDVKYAGIYVKVAGMP